MSLAQIQQDELTGLHNRLGAEKFLQEFESRESDSTLSAASIQISRFGWVNSSLGSELADTVIKKISKRLKSLFKDAGMVARTHGDHFFIVFSEQTSLADQLDKLKDFTQRPLLLDGKVMVLSVRVGYVNQAEHDLRASLLLNASETALQNAKNARLVQCEYTAEYQVEAVKSHQLENDLRVSLANKHVELHRAISNDEFVLNYQPIVNLNSKKVEYFEALIRWYHPKRGFIPPDSFIEIAEQIQVIDVIGNWVIEKAIADMKSWQVTEYGKNVGVSINVSPLQFSRSEILINVLKNAIDKNQVSPKLIKIEITESSAFSDSFLQTLYSVKSLGCEIALDDFGTGHSSLTKLNQLPINCLKLDRSFIQELEHKSEMKSFLSMRLTDGVLNLASTFRLQSVVEGVETASQLDIVKKMGANLIQGFFFSKPLPIEQAHEYLKKGVK
jgi:diguanylate cyclase (GGDEF)-like protein